MFDITKIAIGGNSIIEGNGLFLGRKIEADLGSNTH